MFSMATITIYNTEGTPVGEQQLADAIFGIPMNQDLVHQALVTQQANERVVRAHTKTRGEVRGGGKKPWKQKGTGRARHGSIRSPLWVGGGVVFGPRKDRNYKKSIPKKMRTKALLMCLSDKVGHQKLIALDAFPDIQGKTKDLSTFLTTLRKNIHGFEEQVLVVTGATPLLARAARNLQRVKVIRSENLNIVDVLRYPLLLTTQDIVQNIETCYRRTTSTEKRGGTRVLKKNVAQRQKKKEVSKQE